MDELVLQGEAIAKERPQAVGGGGVGDGAEGADDAEGGDLAIESLEVEDFWAEFLAFEDKDGAPEIGKGSTSRWASKFQPQRIRSQSGGSVASTWADLRRKWWLKTASSSAMVTGSPLAA